MYSTIIGSAYDSIFTRIMSFSFYFLISILLILWPPMMNILFAWVWRTPQPANLATCRLGPTLQSQFTFKKVIFSILFSLPVPNLGGLVCILSLSGLEGGFPFLFEANSNNNKNNKLQVLVYHHKNCASKWCNNNEFEYINLKGQSMTDFRSRFFR